MGLLTQRPELEPGARGLLSNTHRPWANTATGSHTPTTGMRRHSSGLLWHRARNWRGDVGTFLCHLDTRRGGLAPRVPQPRRLVGRGRPAGPQHTAGGLALRERGGRTKVGRL